MVGSRPGLVVMLIVEPISLHSGPRTQWGLYIYTSSFDLIITGSLNPSEMKPVAPTWFVFSSLLCATFSDDPIASVSTTKTLIFNRASRSEGADAH